MEIVPFAIGKLELSCMP